MRAYVRGCGLISKSIYEYRFIQQVYILLVHPNRLSIFEIAQVYMDVCVGVDVRGFFVLWFGLFIYSPFSPFSCLFTGVAGFDINIFGAVTKLTQTVFRKHKWYIRNAIKHIFSEMEIK